MSEHLRSVLARVLSAWEGFESDELDLDALRNSVRTAAGALDGGEAEWRDLLDAWSINLDGFDARVTRYHSKEEVRVEVQRRFAEQVASVRRCLGAVVDKYECPVCEHPWDLHPGVNPWLNVCGMCIAEEDHDERAYEDMCTLEPEAASRPLPVGRLRPPCRPPLLARLSRVHRRLARAEVGHADFPSGHTGLSRRVGR